MLVSAQIMYKVEAKEVDNKNLNRCLDVLICPKCGEALTKFGISEDLDVKYGCSKCQFTHIRMER